MSRIDEALRRTVPGAVTAEPEPLSSTDSRGFRRKFALEDYPLEIAPPAPPVAAPEPPRVVRETAPSPRPEPVAKPAAHEIDPAAAEKLVVSAAVPPVSVEQYRRLAATLYQARVDTGVKTIMVSSALPREGKTLTVTNLGLTLSVSYGQRVLLIDADLRSPSIHGVFGLPNAPGLADYLRTDGAALPISRISPTLSVLPAGSTNGNPIAGLVSDRMKQLLEQMASRFDWVLLDTPPVGFLPDANLLGRLADAVVFVVAAGSSPYALVQRSVTAIGPDRVIGIVLNRAAASTMSDSTYHRDYAVPSLAQSKP